MESQVISKIKWISKSTFGVWSSRIRQDGSKATGRTIWKSRYLRTVHHSTRSPAASLSTCKAPAVDNVHRLFNEIVKENRRSALAQAITLVESSHPTRKKEALHLLTLIRRHIKETQGAANTVRIGISGPPGAGKSTFIEAFGKTLTSQGNRVAVLAVDPSSRSTGGSLLGDKTRMPELSRDPNAYVRPSATRGQLGGVTRSTGEAVVLCEGAGYNVIIVETVGVGQSECAVDDVVDMFVLTIPPASGDELQGIKKGVIEHSDLILITKSDGDLEASAKRVQAEYISALKFVHSASKVWQPKVLRVSAATGAGMAEFHAAIEEFRLKAVASGEMHQIRRRQNLTQMWNHIVDEFLQALRTHPQICALAKEYEQHVVDGVMPPGAAASMLLEEFFKGRPVA